MRAFALALVASALLASPSLAQDDLIEVSSTDFESFALIESTVIDGDLTVDQCPSRQAADATVNAVVNANRRGVEGRAFTEAFTKHGCTREVTNVEIVDAFLNGSYVMEYEEGLEALAIISIQFKTRSGATHYGLYHVIR